MDATRTLPQPENPAPGSMSRAEALARLRAKLHGLVDDGHCACAVASRLGLPCGGFAQFSDEELRRRFSWIARTLPRSTPRSGLENAIDAYLVGRQEVTGLPTTCDVETREHDVCAGWSAFDDTALAELYWKVFGQKIRIGGVSRT